MWDKGERRAFDEDFFKITANVVFFRVLKNLAKRMKYATFLKNLFTPNPIVKKCITAKVKNFVKFSGLQVD